MVVGATPEDLATAQKLVSTSPGYLSKWTKSELVSAAVALRLFIRELPGGPKLLRRAVDLARSTNGGEDERMARAVKAISRQEGVDASLYTPTQAPSAPTTSTQSTGELSDPYWDDLTQIPPNQQARAGAGAGVGGGDGNNEEDELYAEEASVERGEKSKNPPMGLASPGEGEKDDVSNSNSDSTNRDDGSSTIDGKVSDTSSSSAFSLAAPIRTTHVPHKRAHGGNDGNRVVDVGVNDVGVAGGVGGVGGAVGNGKGGGSGKNKTLNKSTSWRPRVCNQVWRGKACPNRSNGCKYAHPTPCSSDGCIPNPANGCRAFHPRVGGTTTVGNGKGSGRRVGAAPTGNSRRPQNKKSFGSGNSGSNRPNSHNRTSSGSNGNNNSHLQLVRRLAAVERRMGETGPAEKVERRPSYRDVAARGTHASGVNSNGNNRAVPSYRGDFAPAQHDPAMLSTVVAAVMAVLSGRGQLF